MITEKEDLAVVAGKEAADAAAAWSAYAKAHPTLADEQTPEYKAVKERSEKADDAFADAPVTSVAGVLVKLRALGKDITEDHGPEGWQQGHVKTVTAFLEGVECAPSVVGPDPAVVALAEYRVAKAADDAISNKDAEAETPEYQATGDRLYAARDAVYIAVPTSMAGMAAKVRYIVDYGERGNDLWPLFDTMAKSMLPFLEGAPPRAPKPDPVATLFAAWGSIQDEAAAYSAADPEATDPEIDKLRDAVLDRRDVVEDKIMGTPATSIMGVAVKIRLASHYAFDIVDLAPLHDTPSRDIDYDGEHGAGGALNDYLVSALRDAERLAGSTS